MSFFRSIAVLTAVCLCVAFAYFFGYGLAQHDVRPMLYGAVLLIAGAAMLWFMGRPGRADAR
ncbi:MAG TPA: hypothetical protein VK936_11735 [Longimicrobiales bacterium]|nr:hypothetical protein [Longimicrobiales bacterium]